jgi:hypothetical protein
MRPSINAILLEPYKSDEKQNMTRAVNAIITELTESAISDTGFTDKKVARK